jgi:hypothetical protein
MKIVLKLWMPRVRNTREPHVRAGLIGANVGIVAQIGKTASPSQEAR